MSGPRVLYPPLSARGATRCWTGSLLLRIRPLMSLLELFPVCSLGLLTGSVGWPLTATGPASSPHNARLPNITRLCIIFVVVPSDRRFVFRPVRFSPLDWAKSLSPEPRHTNSPFRSPPQCCSASDPLSASVRRVLSAVYPALTSPSSSMTTTTRQHANKRNGRNWVYTDFPHPAWATMYPHDRSWAEAVRLNHGHDRTIGSLPALRSHIADPWSAEPAARLRDFTGHSPGFMNVYGVTT